MDLSKVKEIITPAGSLKKILRGDVVIWSKKSDLVYTIWKDGVLIDRVTMPQFVNKIHNGDAQTDYGIGAQIYVPYTDPFNGVTYDCPFNFGTFTQYPGKLGLQTHYTLPTKTLIYGEQKDAVNKDRTCKWEDSYAYKWLNSYGTSHNITVGNYNGTNGFLSCIPPDFIDVLQINSFKNTDCKIFLLTATQHNIANYTKSSIAGTTITYTLEDETEYGVWEYWENLIGNPVKFENSNGNYYQNNIENINTTMVTSMLYQIVPSTVLYATTSSSRSTSRYDMVTIFNYQVQAIRADVAFYLKPACVIG